MKNEKTNPSLSWKIFGFPAKKIDQTDVFESIQGFSSCSLCYQTFVYNSKTGTRNMLAHPCVKNVSLNKITTIVLEYSFCNSSSTTKHSIKLAVRNTYTTRFYGCGVGVIPSIHGVG